VVLALEVLQGDQAQINNEDSNDGAVHGCDEGTGRQELLTAPEEEGCPEENAFEDFVAPAPCAELQENVGGADQHKRQRP